MSEPAAAPDSADDPVAAALRRAPLVRRLTPEQHAELAQDLEDIRAGRAQLVAREEVPAWMEEQARRERGDG